MNNSPAARGRSSMLLHSENQLWQGGDGITVARPCRDHILRVPAPNFFHQQQQQQQQQRAKAAAVSLSRRHTRSSWSFTSSNSNNSSSNRSSRGARQQQESPGLCWRAGSFCPQTAVLASRPNAGGVFCGSDATILAREVEEKQEQEQEQEAHGKISTTLAQEEMVETVADRTVFVVSKEDHHHLDARWRSDGREASAISIAMSLPKHAAILSKEAEAEAAATATAADKAEAEEQEQEQEEQEGKGTLEYYIPRVGDQVMGVVVSGNHSKLEIAIGAERLGHMSVSEMFPLDKRDLGEKMWEIPAVDSLGSKNSFAPPLPPLPPLGQALTVKDEEVLSMGGGGLHTQLPVEVGTILTMDVKGEMASGAALLSARSVARRNAWNRVQQIKDQNEPIEIEITDCNAAGLVSRIEGLRAFLPLYNVVKQPSGFPPECLKDYVGRRMWVQISTIHEENSNLVVNEKQAWVSRNLHLGTLVDGTVAEVYTFGARVKIKDTDISGLLHISNIARAHIPQVEDVFDAGEHVKVMVVKAPSNCSRIAFSTAALESEDGLMLTDRERVFREAEAMAKAYRDAHLAQENFLQPLECLLDSDDEPEKPIANWYWLHFGANAEKVY